MASIQVNVAHIATGKKATALVPDDLPVRDLMPKLINAIGGKPGLPWLLYNKSQGFSFNEGDTLADRGTKAGDTLSLVEQFTAGF